MLYTVKIGPLETHEGVCNAYLAVSEKALGPVALARGDAEGLRELARQAEGVTLYCEPSLAEAGRKLGFHPAPPPPWVGPLRAVVALKVAGGKVFEQVSLPVMAQLLTAALEFDKSAPWEHWHEGQLLRISLFGSVSRQVEGCLLGNGGTEFGVVLCESPGELERALRLRKKGQSPDMARLNVLAVLLEDGPSFAVRSLVASGIPVLPMPLRRHQGEPMQVTEPELLALCAVLRAAAALAPDRWEAVGEGGIGSSQVWARIQAPEPRGVVWPEDEPAPVMVNAGPDVGRNDPCPCGSGKKYKRCHLGADKPPQASAAHFMDGRLAGKLLRFARRRFGETWYDGVIDLYLGGAAQQEHDNQLLVPWMLYEHRVEGRTVAETFLELQGPRLSAAERTWLLAQQSSRVSAWEVRAVRVDEGLTIEDCFTGERSEVQEVRGSRLLLARHVLLGRMVECGGEFVLAGMHPRVLMPTDAAAFLRQAREALGAQPGRSPEERLRARGSSLQLIRLWQAAVRAADERVVRLLPELQNSQGDPLLFVRELFSFDPKVRGELVERLEWIEGAKRSGEEEGQTWISFLRPEAEPLGRSAFSLWGEVWVGADTLRLESDSLRRADELRREVESCCGGLIQHRAREQESLVERRRKPRQVGTAMPPPPRPSAYSPEELATLHQVKARHYERWVDVALPVLDGLTPRQALKTAPDRVEVLLKEVEQWESSLPPEERYDVSILRRQLGLGG